LDGNSHSSDVSHQAAGRWRLLVLKAQHFFYEFHILQNAQAKIRPGGRRLRGKEGDNKFTDEGVKHIIPLEREEDVDDGLDDFGFKKILVNKEVPCSGQPYCDVEDSHAVFSQQHLFLVTNAIDVLYK